MLLNGITYYNDKKDGKDDIIYIICIKGGPALIQRDTDFEKVLLENILTSDF